MCWHGFTVDVIDSLFLKVKSLCIHKISGSASSSMDFGDVLQIGLDDAPAGSEVCIEMDFETLLRFV